MAKKQTLQYAFHNPNTPAKTADFLLELFLEVDQKKIDDALQRANESQEASQPQDNIPEPGRHAARLHFIRCSRADFVSF